MSDEKKIVNPEELSEDELNSVSGGGFCFCTIGGGGTGGDTGTHDGEEYTEVACACVLGGGGQYVDEDGNSYARCVCIAVGDGNSIEQEIDSMP